MLKNNFLSATFLLIGFLLPIAGFSAKYTSVEGKMSIKLEGEYKVTEEANDYGKTVKVNGEFESYTYFVAYTLHNATITDHYNLAKTGLDAFVEALNGTILKQADWYVKKHRGVRGMINMSEYGQQVDYACVLAGDIQYQIAIIGAPADWVQKRVDAIFKSFKISK